ncbi:hypothetical protein Maq22A_1p35625 (plasmid) [Methylobacterium aquaticum]|uniref:Uncharacterized protein n=1 Tax=Methylobacterium aquaticum TaxID=270351 RepID=A0A0C6FUX6_9HYPH|nr:hypothetical protein Maq22A_1p35625 [Methylobacterium aquaticum]
MEAPPFKAGRHHRRDPAVLPEVPTRGRPTLRLPNPKAAVSARRPLRLPRVRTRCRLGSRRPGRCGPPTSSHSAVGGPCVEKAGTAASAAAAPPVDLRRGLRMAIVAARNPQLDETVGGAAPETLGKSRLGSPVP